MDSWRLNGELLNPGDSAGDPEDRGLAYGDGLFETIAIRNGKLRFLERHLARLAEGSERLGIALPDYVSDELQTAAQGTQHGTLKLILTRGAGERGYNPAGAIRPNLYVGTSATTREFPAAEASGITATICENTVSINPALAGLKTLNRLEQVMARAEWSDTGIREGVMLDTNGNVISGTMSNVFAVIDNQLCTPDLQSAGIAGVMRSVILDAAGIDVSVRNIPLAGFLTASEVFFTNSLIGLWPVARLNRLNQLNNLNRRETQLAFTHGPYTDAVRAALFSLGVEECGG